jgi:hypothetical protein
MDLLDWAFVLGNRRASKARFNCSAHVRRIGPALFIFKIVSAHISALLSSVRECVCGEWHSLQAVQRCRWHHPYMAKPYHHRQSRISSWGHQSPSQPLLSLVCHSLSVLILSIFSCFVLSPTPTLLSLSLFSAAKKTLNYVFQLMGFFFFSLIWNLESLKF